MRKRRAGFTLIELLIVVAIIGIIVAMAMMNLFAAIQRAKQRRTMADMRSIATAIEAYGVDFNRYPAAAAPTLPFAIPTTPISGTDLVSAIQPTYMKVVPVNDAWLFAFLYGTGNSNSDYMLVSNGRNGIPESTVVSGTTTFFNADIIFANGSFYCWPEGAQN